VLILLPVTVFIIALLAAFSETEKMLTPVLFAIGALVSAEIAWQIIIFIKPSKKQACKIVE